MSGIRTRARLAPTALAGTLLVIAGLLLAGCTSTTDPKVYVGKTLDVAYADLGSPNLVDLTAQVTGQSADPSKATPSDWLVVAACAHDQPRYIVDLGVIPKSLATPEIRAEAKKGAYDKYVFSCLAATPSSQ